MDKKISPLVSKRRNQYCAHSFVYSRGIEHRNTLVVTARRNYSFDALSIEYFRRSCDVILISPHSEIHQFCIDDTHDIFIIFVKMNIIIRPVRIGLAGIGAWPGFNSSKLLFVLFGAILSSLTFQLSNLILVFKELDLLMNNLGTFMPMMSVVLKLAAFRLKYG